MATFNISSDYQEGPTVIQTLAPSVIAEGRRYRVMYILPVNPGTDGPWGSGIGEAQKNDLANKHGVICVEPSFARWPWYADHASDPRIRQASYMVDVVVPFIDRNYPTVAGPEGRLLAGFSKSGWGAICLLLRYPDVFGRAASWDGPLMLSEMGPYNTAEVFGTAENFGRYRLSDLIERKAHLFRGSPARFAIMGHGNFKADQEEMHRRMTHLGIPHYYENSTPRAHDWHSGWLPSCAAVLAGEPG